MNGALAFNSFLNNHYSWAIFQTCLSAIILFFYLDEARLESEIKEIQKRKEIAEERRKKFIKSLYRKEEDDGNG